MNHRVLGRTGLHVSPVALGTVALGVDYGIQVPEAGRPSAEQAIAMIRAAVAAGINLVDTAPAYGNAESLMGQALDGNDQVIIATKVSLPKIPDGDLRETTRLQGLLADSVDASRRALRRDHIDILQLHNPTVAMLSSPELMEQLQSLQHQGKVSFIGASVYTEDEALAAIASGWIDVIQVAYNLLDQRMATRVFDTAAARGVGVLTRSVYLKGVLTGKAAWLPMTMAAVREASARVCARLTIDWQGLPHIALRFCLTEPRIGSVLLGPSTLAELEQSLRIVTMGPLKPEQHAIAMELAVNDPLLIDPRQWPLS